MTARKKTRALLLFSGGLDSILAAKILEEQGINITALTFVSYFFDAERAKKSAKENNIELRIIDFSDKHLDVVKNPRFGRGSGMNPCIDCHLLMLKVAKKISKIETFLRTQEDSTFIATGEVLGQRPMSQNLKALKLIEKRARFAGKILRPLSAKVLPETKIEKSGMVDRKKLLGISGRSRKKQLALAEKFGIKYFPTPAGGCILTDKEYSKKLQALIENIAKIKKSDIELLRIGRHFWIGEDLPAGRQARIILGRNHEENLRLKNLAKNGDILLEPKNIPGPTALIRGRKSKAVQVFAKKMLQKYTKGAGEELQFKIIAGK